MSLLGRFSPFPQVGGGPPVVIGRRSGYVWDTIALVGTVARSEKTGTVTYIVIRSARPTSAGGSRSGATSSRTTGGSSARGPDAPGAIALSIDTNDTHTTAEAVGGAIRFGPSSAK